MPLGHLLRLAGDPAGDAELLQRYADRRDEAAFAELVRRHGPLVRGVCRRMLGPADADDASQAVFFTLARNAGRVRNADPLGGWLHAVSVRVCRKAWARRPRPVVRPRSATADPADEASWREVAAAVDDALSTLPDRLRQPLVLCYLEGLTRDEAAAKLGWPVATVRGRLDRGRAKLRVLLGRRGFGLPAGLLAVLLTSPRGDAAGWAAGVARTVLDPAGPPTAVAALTVGVGWTMRTKLLLGVATVLAAGGVMVASGGRPPADPPPKAAEAVVPLRGEWVAVTPYPDGSGRRVTTFRFAEATAAVYRLVAEGPGVRSAVELRGTYALSGDRLTFTPTARFVGEEPLPMRDADKAPREYTLAWVTAAGVRGFDLTAAAAEADSPFRTQRFAPAGLPPAGEVPGVLRGPRKPPTKEPTYQGQPLYLELAFGPAAALRVWLVLDGDRVYLDRNGNGDLTDDEESPARDLRRAARGPDGKPRGRNFTLGGVFDRTREVIYSELAMMTVNTSTGLTAAALRLRVDGKHDEKAGLTDLFLTPDPKASRIVHFDADRWTLAPVNRSELTAGAAADFTIRLGTPGVGAGSFVSRANFDLPKDKNPVGEFSFPGVAEPVRVVFARREMSELGVWDRFVGTVAVPAGAGKGPARLTLTYPDCPLGAVPAAESEVWHHPKPPDKR